MNSAPDDRRELDAIDILFLLWILLLVLIWIGPSLKEFTGKGQAFLTEVALMVAVLLYLRYRKLPISEILRWRAVPLSAVGYIVLFGISGAVLLDGLDRIVGLIIPLPPEVLESYRGSLSATSYIEKALVVAALGIAAPFVEESIFRGAIQTAFERRSGVTKGVLMTALIFGAIHFQIAWLIQLLVMSVFLGWMAWRWNSILPAVILHSTNNLLSYYIMFDMNAHTRELYLVNGQLNPLLAVTALIIAYLSLKAMAGIPERQ